MGRSPLCSDSLSWRCLPQTSLTTRGVQCRTIDTMNHAQKYTAVRSCNSVFTAEVSNTDVEPVGRTRNGKANESGWGNSSIASKVVHLDLTLPDKYRNRPEFASKESTYKHWGFDLRTSNKLPIDRLLPDYRSEGCKAIKYPEPAEMPKVSVIIIHFNEPLSTLLRNIISVINNSPPTMLGEIVLVDDNSTIDVWVVLLTNPFIVASKGPSSCRNYRSCNITWMPFGHKQVLD